MGLSTFLILYIFLPFSTKVLGTVLGGLCHFITYYVFFYRYSLNMGISILLYGLK